MVAQSGTVFLCAYLFPPAQAPGSVPVQRDCADEAWPRLCATRGVAIQPRLGRALVFEHDILHACPPLIATRAAHVKLVARVDVAYEDVDLDGKAVKNPHRDTAPNSNSNSLSLDAAHAFAVPSLESALRLRLET